MKSYDPVIGIIYPAEQPEALYMNEEVTLNRAAVMHRKTHER
jgi:hypothetical protein